jgi:hypothetical protein
LAAVLFASLLTLWLGRVDLVPAHGISLRTDLGSHVIAIQHLLESSLPRARVHDWSHQWFSGYPSFYFYFPLPALLIASLSLLMPLNVAAKAVAVMAPALLPPAAYYAVRKAGFSRGHSVSAVAGAVAFLSMTAYYNFGGNILASVIGEYSYALSLAFALLYLAAAQQAARGARRLPHMSLLLAAAALAHVIPTIFAVAGSCALLRVRCARRAVTGSWVVGFGLAAFWALPFLVRSPYMGRVPWPYTLDPQLLLPWPVLIVAPWALAGAAALWRAGVRPGVLAFLGLTAALSYFIPHALFAQQRGLPLAHLCFYLLTGLGIAAGIERSWLRTQRVRLAAWSLGLVTLAAVVVLQIDHVRAQSERLLTSTTPDSAAYVDLGSTLAQLPKGLIHSEFTAGNGALGDRLTTGRLPEFDPDTRTTIGLLRESAHTSPIYYSLLMDFASDTTATFMQMYRAPADTSAAARLARLRQLGVRYFVSYSEESGGWAAAQAGELRKVAAHPGWTIWEVTGVSTVSAVSRVRTARRGETANEWLDHLTDRPEWVLVNSADTEIADTGDAREIRSEVPDVQLGYGSVSFTASAIGIPHVVRVSYFPNWHAYGADGPYHVLPGFMLVIPRQENVVLRFEPTWVEWTGRILTFATLLVLAGILFHSRRPSTIRAGTP